MLSYLLFSFLAHRYPNNWRLNLTDIRKSDGGLYMCQISSFPPKALVTFLNVKGLKPHKISLFYSYTAIDKQDKTRSSYTFPERKAD